MRRIVPISWIFAAAALATWFLPPGVRGWSWAAEGLLYLGVCVVGVVSLRTGIFVPALIRGGKDSPQVFLTYDDGPDPRATPALLDILRSRNVKAAFFLVGSRVREHPEVVRRQHEEGHVLGNHTDRHSVFTNFLFGSRLERELAACQEAVAAAVGVTPRYYRPPYGLASHAVDGVTRKLGLQVVGWQTRSLDGGGLSVRKVVERTLRKVRPGGIILLHDGMRDPERVVAITSRVLDGLQEKGLTPVRLDRLSPGTGSDGTDT